MSTPSKSEFPPASLREICAAVHFETGDTVFRLGNRTHSVFFIEAGSVRLLRYGRAGEDVLLHKAHAGEFIAEASLDSPRYHCDAVAAEPSDLLQYPADALKQMLETDGTFARQWSSLLARELRQARARFERISLKSAAERVRHLLVSEGHGPQCEFRIDGTVKELARTLGLSHEALYRTLAAMSRDGVIDRDRMAIRFADKGSGV
ncbi:MAG: Crp/Fnr family transcriptional regulator [Edaphobacter sp.]